MLDRVLFMCQLNSANEKERRNWPLLWLFPSWVYFPGFTSLGLLPWVYFTQTLMGLLVFCGVGVPAVKSVGWLVSVQGVLRAALVVLVRLLKAT